MTTHVFERVQVVPFPKEEVFPFFADAGNLAKLTPPWLRFRILTPLPIELGEGTLIDYRLWLRFIPILWRTEITAWRPPHHFIDRQVRGPYKVWIHEHTFEDAPEGTRMTDRVEYAAPGGEWIRRRWILPELERIFDFRGEAVSLFFAPPPNAGHSGRPLGPTTSRS